MWMIYIVGGCYDIRWLMELWSTQAKVKGILPIPSWLWCRDSSVFNDPLGNQAAPHCM